MSTDLGAPLRHCGVACLFGVFQVRGQTASTQEIEERIRQLFPDSDLQALNLQQLRRTSESYGIRCQSIHVPAGDILQIPLPAVLYLRPETFRRNSREPGHFVLLQSIFDGSCRILDYTRPMPELIVSVAELTEVWDGKCLIFPQAAGPVTFVNVMVISALAVLVCFAAYKAFSTKTTANRWSPVLAVVLLWLTTGCSSGSMSVSDSPEDASKDPPITTKSDQPLSSVHEHIDLGVIESGQHANARFTIRTWEKEAVTVTGVEKSCSCIMTGEKLGGQTFAAGSEQELTISLPTAHSAGPIRGFVRLTTKPLSSRPLELSVTAIVTGQPTLASGEILLTTPSNQESSAAVGFARFSLIRTGDVPPLRLAASESNLDGLRLMKITTHSRPFEAHGVQVHDCEMDTVEVVLEAGTSAPIGKSRRGNKTGQVHLHNWTRPLLFLPVAFAGGVRDKWPIDQCVCQ
jgi:hypothetical protein